VNVAQKDIWIVVIKSRLIHLQFGFRMVIWADIIHACPKTRAIGPLKPDFSINRHLFARIFHEVRFVDGHFKTGTGSTTEKPESVQCHATLCFIAADVYNGGGNGVKNGPQVKYRALVRCGRCIDWQYDLFIGFPFAGCCTERF